MITRGYAPKIVALAIKTHRHLNPLVARAAKLVRQLPANYEEQPESGITHRWAVRRPGGHLRRRSQQKRQCCEDGVTILTGAREITGEFQSIIRRKALTDLDDWME